jgi:hypothetical protein
MVAWIRGQEIAARNLNELAKNLRLSGKRLTLFKELVVAYRREPTIEHYVRFRREFPEVELWIFQIGGPDPFFALQKKFLEQGIDHHSLQIEAVTAADEPSIDALSLRLLERLIARGKLPKDGPGHIEKRRNAISDTTVNYLISVMLESMLWNDAQVRMPTSLIVLIREQLCGRNPDLYKEYLLKGKRRDSATAAAKCFPQGKISVRKLAAALNVSRGTAARWLTDREFLEWLEWARKNRLSA